MLNEKQEYQLYLTPDYGQLLRREPLKEGLSGCRAVLTVLARGFFDLCRQNGIDDLERLHRYGIVFLKVWLVGQEALLTDTEAATCAGEMQQHTALHAELKRAQESNLLDYINRLDIPLEFSGESFTTPRARREKMLSKIRSWEKSMFYSFGKDSQNQIYFKVIIADALHKGPLTDKVLLLRRENDAFGWEGSSGHADLTACTLAVVGVYLQYKAPTQNSVLLTVAQLSHYLNKAPSSKGAKKLCVSRLINKCPFSYNGAPLFVKTMVTGGNSKLTVNPQWIRDMDVHLADAHTTPAPGYVCLTDADLFPDRFSQKQVARETIR